MKTATFTISQLVCRPIGYNKHCDLRIVLCLTEYGYNYFGNPYQPSTFHTLFVCSVFGL